VAIFHFDRHQNYCKDYDEGSDSFCFNKTLFVWGNRNWLPNIFLFHPLKELKQRQKRKKLGLLNPVWL
jgi:hypothetical protein